MTGPLIIDVEGFALTAEEKERLAHPWVGGVILFTRNFESIEQVTELTRSIHAIRPGGAKDGERLLVSIDHEGGRVQRFRKGFTHLPSFRVLAEALAQGSDAPGPAGESVMRASQAARQAGIQLAAELRAIGVDFSYTPVLDLDYGRSEVIGDRSFHRSPAWVSLMAAAMMQGLSLSGFKNCGKHFPGHGWAQADSHHDLPVDERDLESILRDDCLPYAELAAAPQLNDGTRGPALLTAVMPAHVRYPQVDDSPAGFSSVWIREILRERLGFDGVVISDDLSMAGAAIYEDVADRAQAAFEAGCDATLICNRPDLAVRALDEMPKRMPQFLSSSDRRGLGRLMPHATAPQ
jgi:beta-N-acetylhexosaminidase